LTGLLARLTKVAKPEKSLNATRRPSMTRRKMLKVGRGRVATVIAAAAGLLAAGASGAVAALGG
jgi:hypothetical protein